jgi:hypothetical protein
MPQMSSMGEDELENSREEFKKFLVTTGEAEAYMKIFETVFISGYMAGVKRGLSWAKEHL